MVISLKWPKISNSLVKDLIEVCHRNLLGPQYSSTTKYAFFLSTVKLGSSIDEDL